MCKRRSAKYIHIGVKMKIAAFSDCHWLYKDIKYFPEADLCIFAGDWCGSGYYINETTDFLSWFKDLPYKHKVAIPGNHDRLCELNENMVKDLFLQAGSHLLIDEQVVIEGISIYGSPWSPFFNNWAYMLPEEQLKWKFKHIPNDVDVLVTHTPPKGILDPDGYGSEALRKRLNDVHPKIHIFGHNHGGYGYKETINTKFYNVAVCSDADKEHHNTYELVNPISLINL